MEVTPTGKSRDTPRRFVFQTPSNLPAVKCLRDLAGVRMVDRDRRGPAISFYSFSYITND